MVTRPSSPASVVLTQEVSRTADVHPSTVSVNGTGASHPANTGLGVLEWALIGVGSFSLVVAATCFIMTLKLR